MRKALSIGVCTLGIIASVYAQNDMASDTVLERQVTVEREFQPIIQDAGKLNVPPERISEEFSPAEPHYSMWANPLQTNFNITPINCSKTSFSTKPRNTRNYLEGALGHPLTKLNFNYHLAPHKTITMDLYAHHDAYWGRKTWSESTVGMDFQKQFSDMALYFTVRGNNRFYTSYGRYYDGYEGLNIAKYKDLLERDKTNIWEVNTKLGIRSHKGNDFQYRIETGYNAFILPSIVAEHHVRTHADIQYSAEVHNAGIHLFVQNSFYSVDQSQHLSDTAYNSRHGIRIEPYYEYVGDAVRLHVGAHMDMNIGKGQQFSSNRDLSFAPSPNVNIEYRIIPEWLALYGGAKGSFGFGTLEGYLNMNPYLEVIPGVTSHHVSGYVPVDAYLGFKIRPISTFLIDVYAHYALQKNQSTFLAPDVTWLQSKVTAEKPSYLDYFYSDYQQWKVGAELTYHYQDIVHILLSGNYYVWKQDTVELLPAQYPTVVATEGRAYDRPSWDLHLRVDARINSKWSLYSDNLFAGSRWAMTTNGDVKLKPTINLALGCRYEINSWLGCYVELNNLLNRKNDIFYGYQSLGINGLAGVKWKF